MRFVKFCLGAAALFVVGVLSVTLLGCSKANQNHANELFDKGRLAQQHGDYKTALADYNQADSLAHIAPMSYDRGLAYYNLKQYANADSDFTEALSLAKAGDTRLLPKFVRAAYYYRGLSRIQEGKWAGAKDDLRLAVGSYPKSSVTWDSLGYARAQLGDYKDAIPDYNRGLELYANDAIDRNNRGLAFFHTGQLRSAVSDYTKAIHLAPRWGLPYQNRGQVYFAAADYRDADSDFSRAIKLIPKAWAWGYRCETRENLGRVKEAMYDCNQALAFYPTWSNVYVDRAWAKATLGANKSALADANNAVKYDPHSAIAYAYRGWIRQRLMQYRGAFIDYDKALHISPHYSVAVQDRAQLGNFIVAAQQAGVTSYGIGSLNVSQMENAQEPTQTEYQQRTSECGGYYSQSDSYFDDCVQNGVSQAKNDESADQEASDQAASDSYNAQQQIQEQINYDQQAQQDAAAQAQQNQDYANNQSDNSGSSDNSGYGDNSGSSDNSGYSDSQPADSGGGYQESAPVESEPVAPAEDGGGGL